jgi:hypothetical protein
MVDSGIKERVRRSAKTPRMGQKIEEKIAVAFFEANDMAIDPRSGPALPSIGPLPR